MKKNDYCMIIPASKSYLPGLNAMLNSLDYFDNEIDVFIIDAGDIPPDYIEQIKKTFTYRIEVVPITSLTPGLRTGGDRGMFHLLITTPYVLMKQLKDEYKLVSFFGADCCVCANIMQWFELAEKTGWILTANNPFALAFFCPELRVDKANGLLEEMPLGDTPGIMSPVLHEDLIDKTLALCDEYGDNMRCYGTAMHALNKFKQTLVLPGMLWTSGTYSPFTLTMSKDAKGRSLLYANREQVFAFHRRWWSFGVREMAMRGMVPGTELHARTKANTDLWDAIYKLYNTQLKVRINYNEYHS